MVMEKGIILLTEKFEKYFYPVCVNTFFAKAYYFIILKTLYSTDCIGQTGDEIFEHLMIFDVIMSL
jgi:hypothetical protein